MFHDLSHLRSLIQIQVTPTEHTLGLKFQNLFIYTCAFLCSNVVIASAASFHDIETDWKWLEKYLLETLGKF